MLSEANIGIIGHVDHGKTTLTQALSGKWADTHSEELKKGITIKLGYADVVIRQCEKCSKFTVLVKCECGGGTKEVRKVSLVDAPGHESLMAIMISGAAIMDYALLLVAANEEVPQPQTKEHVRALKLRDKTKLIVVQNKVDLVSESDAKKNYEGIKKFLGEQLGEDKTKEIPIVPISAQKRINIDFLLLAIQKFFPTPKRVENGEPLMLIARSFDINRPGTPVNKLIGGVIGGAIIRGKIKEGDSVEIKPGVFRKGRWEVVRTSVHSIYVGDERVKEKGAGGSISMSLGLDPFLSRADSLSGNVLGLVGKTPNTTDELSCEIFFFEEQKPISIDEPLMLSMGTTTTIGFGQKGKGNLYHIRLKRPICVLEGEKLALARKIGTRFSLVGYGVIRSVGEKR